MTKYLLLALLSAPAGACWAQSATLPIPAGTVLLGGSVHYYQQHGELESNTLTATTVDGYSAGVNPMVGVFVAPNWVVGLGLDYGTDKLEYNSTGTTPYTSAQHSRSYSAGPYVRYYRLLVGGLGLTGTLNAYYLRFTNDYERLEYGRPASGAATGNAVGAGLTPGLVYFPVSRLAIGASIGSLGHNYSTSRQENSDGYSSNSKTSNFGAYFGLNQLAFSGTYFFRRE